ncbi:MAG: hypothetical protein F6J89_07020 [Symploca sp. SIO1C4]|uniref:Uncharacterized protein n=1 Tax=Symploca sp. SIO1C4 TaxID=2607765 RepID=A0A6B3N2I5_9CYAN|nr:hypothetical protein [Symploca sp. SIO1C4]
MSNNIPKTIIISIDSPANISFRYEEELAIDEVVGDPEDWGNMTEEEKYEAVKEVALELLFEHYIEWSYKEK